MKHPILQKSHGSILTGSCGKLSLAGSICRSLHLVMWEVFTKAGSLDSLHAHLGCLLLVFGAAVVMAMYEQDTTEGTHLLRKFPDICTVKEKSMSSDTHWKGSASSDSDSTWLSRSADAQQGPHAVVGAMPKDKCSLCLGCNLAVFIQAKSHGAWLEWEGRLRPTYLINQ